MKKWFKILLGGFVLLLVAFFGLRTWTKSFSPEALEKIEKAGFTAEITYCRPSKKGRVIFGGLVPYGKVWRTGANEATVIQLGQDTNIAGSVLPKGNYSLWTIPQQDEWTIIFNKETGQWGTNYNPEEDILKVKVTPRYTADTVEMFTISFHSKGNDVEMVLAWDNVQVAVPMKKAN
ncbi:MAG: DUF2911 domain-containing protein [Cytophagales bacterium]|nr:DUF2911 domain-containing protein [Bernardetiaceae bacterium]MDW8205211.1 DUF2911 domain-containing protein [Cytophagales bacterium]